MPIGCRRADPGKPSGLREGKSGRSLRRDQFQRGADQRLAQIAVMIAARRVGLASLVLPAHVRGVYIAAGNLSMLIMSARDADPSIVPAGAAATAGISHGA